MSNRIEYLDLLYSIYATLKAEFSNSKIEMGASKTEIKKPTFLIQIRPNNQDAYRQYDKELVNVTITYTDVVMNQEKTLPVESKLNEIFNQGITVNDVFIYFEKKSINEIDDFINFNFTLNYFNAKSERNIPANDKYTEMMQELDIDINEFKEVIN